VTHFDFKIQKTWKVGGKRVSYRLGALREWAAAGARQLHVCRRHDDERSRVPALQGAR